MRVKTYLNDKPRSVVTTEPHTSFEDAMDLLISNNIGCLPVVDKKERIVGIVSDKDLFRKVHQTKGKYASLKVEDVMSTDVITCSPDDELAFLSVVMNKKWIRHIPIVEKSRIIGLISLRDINRAQIENTELENRFLKLYTSSIGTRDKSSDF